jgi:hypothetical protein
VRRAAPVPEGQQRCNQCWTPRPIADFTSTKAPRGGHPIVGTICVACRRKYRGWSRKTFDEKLAAQSARPATGNGYRVGLTFRSGNRKTGPIPVSMTDRASCPSSCSFQGRGCYAEFHVLRKHWDEVGRRGMTWRAFCEEVARLPEGTLWRHNEAGDLPGKGDELDVEALGELVEANRGRRGFTYTHKHRADAYELLQWANLEGFTINLSADSLEAADALYQDGDTYLTKAGPVVVVLPADAPDEGVGTPQGRRVVVCPAQTSAQLTCASCQLCALPFRKAIVGFRAHGQYKGLVTELVRPKRVA